MPNDDYTSAIGGGLKLKGSKPSGVKKKKRSKPSSSSLAATSASASTDTPASRTEAERESQAFEAERERELGLEAEISASEAAHSDTGAEKNYKTPAERRHEEMRRKRLEERLKREGGVKTHKQRVEELNRYLSGLSEHHDMYVFVIVLGGGWGRRGGEGRLLMWFVVGLESDRDNRRREQLRGCDVLLGMGVLGYMDLSIGVYGVRGNHEGKAEKIVHMMDFKIGARCISY
jgi:protein FAM32A